MLTFYNYTCTSMMLLNIVDYSCTVHCSFPVLFAVVSSVAVP